MEKLKPLTLAVIQGVCLGGGLEFALACDVRVAIDDPSTRIGLPETQLGILPGWGGTQRLTRLIGPTHALQLILQGTRIKPDRALKIGLVDEMIAADSLEQKLGEYRQGTVQKADKARSWPDWGNWWPASPMSSIIRSASSMATCMR